MSDVIEFRRKTISRLLSNTQGDHLDWVKGSDFFDARDELFPDYALYINDTLITLVRRLARTQSGNRKVITVSLLDSDRDEFDSFSDYSDSTLAPEIRTLYQAVENSVRGITANYNRVLSGLLDDEIPF